jgi:phage gpG-like protein
MPRGKSIACREDKITSNSSSSDADNHELLGANQEQASTHNTGSLSAMLQHQEGSLHSGIHLPASTRPNKRMTFQCKFDLLSQRHV